MKNGKIVITHFNNAIITSLLDERNEVIEISFEMAGEERYLNNIYVGRVKNIAKNINAAFIEYQKDKVGYFSLEKYKGKLNQGDLIVVQVAKDNVKTKFPVLTDDFNITGKNLVLITGNSDIHFSNKIKDKDEVEKIKKIIEPCTKEDFGFIVRTNAINSDRDSLLKELIKLKEIYNEIKIKSDYRVPFTMLYEAPKDYIMEVINSYDQNYSEIVTDVEEIYNEIKKYLIENQKENLDKLRFYNDEMLPLAKLYSVEKALSDATRSRVWLKSGAYLIIQPTEALVVIDVNSGKNVDRKSKREQFLNINLEAAKEIAKQLRLRNLSGIIIVDFINMESEEDKQSLLKTFEYYLKEDNVKTTLVGMTRLNLVELTRKKIKKPLFEQINTCKQGFD